MFLHRSIKFKLYSGDPEITEKWNQIRDSLQTYPFEEKNIIITEFVTRFCPELNLKLLKRVEGGFYMGETECGIDTPQMRFGMNKTKDIVINKIKGKWTHDQAQCIITSFCEFLNEKIGGIDCVGTVNTK